MQKDKLGYAHSSDVSADDLYSRKSFLSGDDLVKSELINDELSDSTSYYYENVRDIDTLEVGNLLLRKRRSVENVAKIVAR